MYVLDWGWRLSDIITVLLDIWKSHKSIYNSMYGSYETSRPGLYVNNEVSLLMAAKNAPW